MIVTFGLLRSIDSKTAHDSVRHQLQSRWGRAVNWWRQAAHIVKTPCPLV